jgi:phosphoglycolate phosphatase
MRSLALIFDLDGTLVDTAPDLLDALNAVLTREGRRNIDLADLNHLVGHGAQALLAEAFVRTGEAAERQRLPELIETFISQYRAHIADKSCPYPRVAETLMALREQGARLGVLTNKPQELTIPLLEAVRLAPLFHAIHGAGRYSFTKPDPRVLRHVIEELGGAGDGAIMIGDSVTDVATARAAKIPVILRAGGYTPTPAHALGADAIVDRFEELPDAIQILWGREKLSLAPF